MGPQSMASRRSLTIQGEGQFSSSPVLLLRFSASSSHCFQGQIHWLWGLDSLSGVPTAPFPCHPLPPQIGAGTSCLCPSKDVTDIPWLPFVHSEFCTQSGRPEGHCYMVQSHSPPNLPQAPREKFASSAYWPSPSGQASLLQCSNAHHSGGGSE